MSFWTDPIAVIANLISGWLSGLGMTEGWIQFVLSLLGAGVFALIVMLFVVLLIWLERKLIGRFQDRLGPNRLGPWGIFQTIADMLKIFTKEFITPNGVDKVPYNLAPMLAVAGVLAAWAVIPLGATIFGTNLNVGVLYVVAIGALGELGIILAGWSSRNKYATLGGFRAVALLISYEVPLVVSLVIPVLFSGSMGLNDIVHAQKSMWYIVLAPLASLIFLISSIAENGRAPFDLTEADSEIVAGFNVEYSGLKFGMFYVADFMHTFTIAFLFAALWMGGWQGPWAEKYPMLGVLYIAIKAWVIYFTIIWLRASLPRFRIDQMINLNWKVLTPLALVILMVTAIFNRIIPADMLILRTIVLLGVNAVVLLATSWLLNKFTGRKKRLVVALEPRPVARPDRASSES
jgi:NADH-quinone oxidoreductase subunit H